MKLTVQDHISIVIDSNSTSPKSPLTEPRTKNQLDISQYDSIASLCEDRFQKFVYNVRIINVISLFLADMTFANEGNKTYLDDLVNFEKMVS